MFRTMIGFGLIAGLAVAVSAEDSNPASDLPDYRTTATAITAKLKRQATSSQPSQPGYLGVFAEADKDGRVVVENVAANSPAAKAGMAAGDIITRLGEEAIKSADQFRTLLLAHSPGDAIKLAILRGTEDKTLEATIAAVSRPLTATGGSDRVILGVRLAEGDEVARIDQITRNSPAARAGLRTGDVILRIDDKPVNGTDALRSVLDGRRAGEKVKVVVRRDDAERDYELELVSETGGNLPAREDPFTRSRTMFTKTAYRLAIVPIEYPDVKHNEKITTADWTEALFSEGRYADKSSATGQRVYGSLHDYYLELSYGHLRVAGQFFDWVQVAKNRSDYSQGTGTGAGTGNRTALLSEALDKLLERDGKDALADFDGVLFMYAGGRVQTTRGGLYWPHRSSVTHRGHRWSYFIVPEGSRDQGGRFTMGNISVLCHEFGHMLGLPDLYARPESPGSEGMSIWCAMSNQAPSGRPQHFSAWCKEQLGWLQPAVIDPTVRQKLVLAPVENTPTECFKVLVRPDGSEYLLLENRRQNGFDASLPAQGLLIWRVVNGRPMLEESHGVEGPAGPGIYRDLVPYPSRANSSFTPFTTPSSRSLLGGGLPVHLTNIEQLPDGRVTFWIGYEFQ